ncbi:hypothetical protein ACHAQH_010001 [Verticillium albo-atrum]
MAEVVGVLSGSIAFAEVAVGAVRGAARLRQLWQDVKDVPDTVGALMLKIEILEPIIWSLEQGFSDGSAVETSFLIDDTPIKKSAELCRRTLDLFTQLVDDLSAEIAAARGFRRAKAKVKVALGKGTLAQFEQRMKDAIDYLSIAQSFHTQ